MSDSTSRPDPDALLEQLREDEARAARGKLRIYFGSSAGVGKTYAMLLAARKLSVEWRAEGRELLVGVVETHGRSETMALTEGLEILPPRQIEYRGKSLPEFDLDGALARHPTLILVDELAHSNVAGSRHPKRWQDVEELLANGISVYTTLNVQHLESLNDVVGGITGVRVYETLPDTFFDAADEVVMVDTPADELLARLKAGKVYAGTQAERAAKNFFRKGNLMALRELALRRTADRVEDDVQAWRSRQSIVNVWKTEAAILCAIGPHAGAEHVVRSAARLAQQLNVSWHAVYVETPALRRLSDARRERILRVVRLAHDLGAATAVLQAQDLAPALVAHARENNLSQLVLGRAAARPAWRRLLTGASLHQRLAHSAADVDLIEVGQPAAASPVPDAVDPGLAWGRRWQRYAWAALACIGTTALARPLQPYFDEANIVMLFLLTVLGVSLRWGRGPSVLASFLSVGLFDFFFIAPHLSFAVSDVQYLLTFVVMLAVGLITGQLTVHLRYQAQVAAEREARSRALFELTRELSGALQTEQVVQRAQSGLARELHGRALVLALDMQDALQLPGEVADAPDLGTARWALDHGQAAGLATDTLPGSAWFYLPLQAPMRARGVLCVRPRDLATVMQPERRAQLDTFASIIGQALERVHYVEVAQDALVHIESERLRNSLLSALSHDLRTPLAVVYGLADTLAALPALPEAGREMAQALQRESQRISAMVNNLLDMARLQSGAVQLRLQWQPVEEVVGSALQAMQTTLGRHELRTELPADLPMINLDAVLIERVLCNLLENAAKYTPPGSVIRIVARVHEDELRLSVADNGPGLPPGREEALFEKFARGERESSTPGVGLGLAICRAIMQAHQGRIWAERAAGGGAVFVLALPLGTPPTLPVIEDHE
jgi:two-component system, OmpR family, sensor histidine kinase KdpD